MLVFVLLSAFIWLVILVLPWKPWATSESLDVEYTEIDKAVSFSKNNLSDITIVIPARNEEQVLQQTLLALVNHYPGLKVIVVDDNSTDSTAEIVESYRHYSITLLQGRPLEAGWSGKLWAQHQAVMTATTSQLLFLDADITLTPGLIEKLSEIKHETQSHLVSLMVTPSLDSRWERLLMPAFIYFFKFLYPFRLSNQPNSSIAAAAGGCILLDKKVLDQIGGLNVIRNALIDDCSLAKAVKSAGFKTWIGLTHSAWSHRGYEGLSPIWNMVARTAYTQLMYSVSLLLLCSFMLVVLFILPVVNLFILLPFQVEWVVSLVALLLMASTYLPTLQFYRLPFRKAFELPLIALLYLIMTWHSALRYFRGERSRWKDRIYEVN